MEKNNLDRLFKEGLKGSRTDTPEEDWAALDITLTKLKFFRFGWTYFNIYYCALIGMFFTLATLNTAYIVYKIHHSNIIKVDSSNAPLIKRESDRIISDSTHKSVIEPINSLPKVINKPYIINKQLTKNNDTLIIGKQPVQIKQLTPVLLDSINNVGIPLPEKPIIKPRLKKTIYLHKRDTIIKKDTMKIIRRK